VHEEQHLYGQEELSDHDQVRLEKIQVELDQCWDLLRQRRARREFGQDPDDAKVRPRAGRRALQTVDVNPPTLVMNSPAATGGKLNAIDHRRAHGENVTQPDNRGDHRHTEAEERLIREAALDETIAASFPASDPPSTDPNPDAHDALGNLVPTDTNTSSQR